MTPASTAHVSHGRKPSFQRVAQHRRKKSQALEDLSSLMLQRLRPGDDTIGKGVELELDSHAHPGALFFSLFLTIRKHRTIEHRTLRCSGAKSQAACLLLMSRHLLSSSHTALGPADHRPGSGQSPCSLRDHALQTATSPKSSQAFFA